MSLLNRKLRKRRYRWNYGQWHPVCYPHGVTARFSFHEMNFRHRYGQFFQEVSKWHHQNNVPVSWPGFLLIITSSDVISYHRDYNKKNETKWCRYLLQESLSVIMVLYHLFTAWMESRRSRKYNYKRTIVNTQSQMQRALLHESKVHTKFQVTKKVFVLGYTSQL